MTFIGRQDELAFLEDCYANNKAQLVVLYGRRRVGKTELLAQFARNKQHVFFASPSATKDEQLAAFSRQMFEAGAPAGRYLQQYSDWESALADIVNLPTQDGKRRLIIIDEFPYLAKSDSSLPSVLQNLWDHTLKDSNVMMVLCGSSMSFIEKEMLSEKSPLYGRATGVLKLLPMPYWDAAQFFPDYSAQDNALAYAILGGIPHYLAQFDPSESVENNIRRTILRRGMPLYSETEFLMHQEFREPATYNTILQAVALGATQLNDIAQRTMLSGSAVSTYLKNLMEVHIVEREFPVDAKPVEQSKAMRGLYQVSDSFFRFWYAFVGSNRSELEMGDAKGVYEYEIAPYLHDFAAASFERMCADWLRRKSMQGELGFRASHVGRWWDSTREIDVVAIDKTNAHVLVGECKFRNKPMDNAMLESLRNKSLALRGSDRAYYLFSLNGFDRGVQAVADRDPSVKLIGIDDLYDL
nr:ATP-binding protein [Bifidobacterium catenulatum]